MEKTTFKKIKRWLKIILVVYVVIGIALYFLQEKFIFHPESLPADHPFSFREPFTAIDLPVNPEKNLSIVRFTVPDSISKGVVLYFHGNRQNIERYAPFALPFTRNHFEVWMIDYPGFGKSTGPRSEKIMYEDAAILYQMARGKFTKDSIIIYGKSLGTGVATQLASVKDCRRLILETPYYSMDALMKRYAFLYPVSLMSKYHFPTWQYLQKTEAPITLIHGTEDEVIPYGHSVRLKKVQPHATLISIENGKHNDLAGSPFFQQQLDSLLNLP
jgi:pimeloyl-ACP methyl ester carboxylesterase